jgi:hypothetical protein
MRNIILTISIFFCLQLKAQDNLNCFIIKGKLEKNINFKKDCGDQYPREIAVVLEITVTNIKDIERFGEKIYVAQICPEVPGDGWFDGKEYDIEIREEQMWQWKIEILNPELFEKNKGRKQYWMGNICCKHFYINCSPK